MKGILIFLFLLTSFNVIGQKRIEVDTTNIYLTDKFAFFFDSDLIEVKEYTLKRVGLTMFSNDHCNALITPDSWIFDNQLTSEYVGSKIILFGAIEGKQRRVWVAKKEDYNKDHESLMFILLNH